MLEKVKFVTPSLEKEKRHKSRQKIYIPLEIASSKGFARNFQKPAPCTRPTNERRYRAVRVQHTDT